MTRDRALPLHRPALPALLAPAALIAALLLALTPAAHAGQSAVVWNAPARADQARYAVSAGSQVAFTLKASTKLPGAKLTILPVGGLPQGARRQSSSGRVATATFRWIPTAGGDYTVRFVASAGGAAAPVRRYTIHVTEVYPLADEKVAHWAAVLRPAVVRSAPSASARAVTRLETTTSDDTQNLVLVLAGVGSTPRETWYRVRLPILPNNSTGWVPASALGDLYEVHTHLYVDRAKLRATLKRDGRTMFTTIVGLGRAIWPTPPGEFYVRDQLTNFDNPSYGPVAFGTSARAPTLTDWPGGGFIGIHGTNTPQILPGYVSHGCIRMPNASILKLAKLMPVGTPVTIR